MSTSAAHRVTRWDAGAWAAAGIRRARKRTRTGSGTADRGFMVPMLRARCPGRQGPERIEGRPRDGTGPRGLPSSRPTDRSEVDEVVGGGAGLARADPASVPDLGRGHRVGGRRPAREASAGRRARCPRIWEPRHVSAALSPARGRVPGSLPGVLHRGSWCAGWPRAHGPCPSSSIPSWPPAGAGAAAGGAWAPEAGPRPRHPARPPEHLTPRTSPAAVRGHLPRSTFRGVGSACQGASHEAAGSP